MAEVTTLSGIQATGIPHIGNYFGAIRHWAEDRSGHSCYMVADLHALTVPRDPSSLAQSRLLTYASLIACGLIRDNSIVFFQSDVAEHSQLSWLLGGVAKMGELRRMTQFKAKADSSESAVLDLFAYPVLQAADILLYRPKYVPVGDDQVQHIELARDVAVRFNNTYGDTFAVPKAVTPAVGARIMDLQNPTTKMSKSAASTSGVIFLNDSNEQIDKKFRKAVTDNDSEIRFDIEQKPGVSNLISILAAASGTAHADIETLASGKSYGWLKAEASESVQAAVTPIRERLSELLEDKDKLMAIAAQNAEQARALASPVYVAARNAMGLGNFPI